MADIWLPGYERWELPGVPGLPYDEPDDPKAVLHTTEGSSIDGAVSAYRAYPPQLIVDPVRRRRVQHIPLNRAGYALWNADADDSRCYQVEIVGFASQTHLWSDDVLRWLAENLFRPLHEYGGVPYTVVWKGFRRDGEMPYALASASSPLRLTQAELDRFAGFLGHQHIPGDSHWDPGGLNVPKIISYAQEEDVSAQEVWHGIRFGDRGAESTPAQWVKGANDHGHVIRYQALPALRALMEQTLAVVTNDPDITPDAMRQIVDTATSKAAREQAQLVAASIKADLLPLVEQALKAVQDADNADEARRTAVEFLNIIKGVTVPDPSGTAVEPSATGAVTG